MDPRVAPLVAIFELNTDLLLKCLLDLSQGEAERRLESGGNSLLFLGSHLSDSRHLLAGRVGHPLPNPLSRYLEKARSIEEVHEWPSLDELSARGAGGVPSAPVGQAANVLCPERPAGMTGRP